jgi:hypothetical protein
MATSAGAVVVGFIASAIQNTLESNALVLALAAFAYVAAGGAIAALVVAATVGLLWHARSKARGWTNVHIYWVPGALVGLLLPLSVVLVTWDHTILSTTEGLGKFLAPIACPFGAALGGLTGYFFWLIRRPDRDANPPTSAS